MSWQLLLVILIVAGAGLYLARATWRTWSGKKSGCAGSCGCEKKPSPPALIPPEQLTLRRRDG